MRAERYAWSEKSADEQAARARDFAPVAVNPCCDLGTGTVRNMRFMRSVWEKRAYGKRVRAL